MFLLFQFVAESFGAGEIFLKEQQQVMSKALENRMALLGFKRACPRFAFAHFAFELVEDLLDVPTMLIKQNELVGRQGM